MANPNIAAISELHVGTLGFNLKTNGATFVSPRVLANTTTTSWDHPTATSIYGYTLSDTLMMCAQAYDSGRSTTSMSYNSDAMTLVYDETEFVASSPSGALGYKVNPDIGDYDMSVSMGGSGNFANISSFWGNIDQTNPLKTFDGHNYQSTPNDYGFGKVHEVTGGYTDSYRNYMHEGSRAHLFNMIDQACEPGDVGVVSITMDSSYSGMIGYGNTYLLASVGSGSTQNTYCYLQQFIISPDGGKNIVPNRFRRLDGGGGSGASYSSRGVSASLVILQSSRTEDTLFECPSDRVLKINSIMAANPEAAGTYVNVSLAGLGAVNDTAGSAAVTPTGNDASVRLAQGVKVPMGKSIELLNRPIYMVEGDSLTANAKSSGFMPQDANRGVDIIVSFESMED
tara:strand:- start:793 stop:1986 length:1194 start_codon:yes stop_codon:yes gene_type:complete